MFFQKANSKKRENNPKDDCPWNGERLGKGE